MLEGKEETIHDLSARYGMKASVTAVVNWEICAHPVLNLGSEQIAFLDSIHAEFSIDPYIYLPGDEESEETFLMGATPAAALAGRASAD